MVLPKKIPLADDEAIGIEHGVAIGEPFAFRQHAVDLLQVAVESLKAGVFERGEGSRIGRIPRIGSVFFGANGLKIRNFPRKPPRCAAIVTVL